MAFPGDYTLLRKIPIDATAVTGSNDDFTCLITEAVFKASKTFIFSNTDNGGGDVRFSTDEAGTVQIAIDVVSWDTSGETCEVHCLADGVDDVSPTDLYIWGDNTGDSQPAVGAAFGRNAVWAAYEYATHDGVTDVTGNYTITQTGSPGAGTNPWGGASVTLDGSTQYGRASATLTNSNVVTLSYWQKADTTNSSLPFGVFASGSGTDWVAGRNDGSSSPQMWRRIGSNLSTAATSSGTYSTGVWAMVTGQSESDTLRSCFLDGANKGTNTDSVSTSASLNRITYGRADDSSPGGYFDGEMSEIRLGYFVKSDDFISTEYSNQNDPAGFYLEPVAIGGGVSIPVIMNQLRNQGIS